MSAGREEVPCRDTDPIPKTPPEEEVEDMKEEEATPSSPAAQSNTAFTVDFDDGPKKKLGLRDGIRHFAPFKKSREKSKASPTEDKSAASKVDVENNNNIVEADFKNQGDDGSDAGTYTIDDDSSAVESDRKKIDEVFKVEETAATDRVSHWAAHAQQQQQQQQQQQPQPSSASPTERARRKLPATPGGMLMPESVATSKSPISSSETENYLQDTMTVVAAMEARIISAETSKTVKTPPLSKEEQKKLAWERRKNYDPLRAAGKKVSEPATPQHLKMLPKTTPPGSSINYQEESCSDSCSEVEQMQQRRLSATTKSRVAPSISLQPCATKPNRAFALRKKLNSADDAGSLSSSSRGEAGRSSLRGRPSSFVTKSVVGRTVSSNGRSSSSLSSKEAEFQAWKRRKNYNPMRSSRPSRPSPLASSSAAASPRDIAMTTSLNVSNSPSASSSSRNGHSSRHQLKHQIKQQHRVIESCDKPMQRSASFHYPDGLSRVPPHVYSSEDESSAAEQQRGAEEYSSLQGWAVTRENHQLLEVDDDEFILAIGNSSSNTPPPPSSRTSVRSRTSLASAAASSQSSSRTSPRRLEALDNLVISTLFSLSSKLCASSANLVRNAQVASVEQQSIMDTLVSCLLFNKARARLSHG